ncbi:hypothetical protein F4803DRAFT_522785 [Xylaria telfairii]|nr:hypothetical protein F4803DRAFT_522785 [Xylaria telfairii]
MAYLSLTAQIAMVGVAIVAALFFLACFYIYSRCREEHLESDEEGRGHEWQKHELETRSPTYKQQQWDIISSGASTLSYPASCWAPLPTLEVKRYQGYMVNETNVMEPHTARIEYAL